MIKEKCSKCNPGWERSPINFFEWSLCGANAACSYTVAHPNEYVSPDTCAFSSEPIEEQFSGPTPGKDVHKVLCPHGCGTSLTGTHAYGNLTRHQKSRVCKGSGRAKTRYHCQMQGCTRVYSRSDGLKVHMRRRHGAPLEGPKGEEICGEVGYRYVLGDTGSRW